jgi:hypothetical protein
MPVGAISQASGADLVSALSQNAGQAQGVQTSAAIAALQAAIDGENQSILELLSGTVEPGAPSSQLNVYA